MGTTKPPLNFLQKKAFIEYQNQAAAQNKKW